MNRPRSIVMLAQTLAVIFGGLGTFGLFIIALVGGKHQNQPLTTLLIAMIASAFFVIVVSVLYSRKIRSLSSANAEHIARLETAHQSGMLTIRQWGDRQLILTRKLADSFCVSLHAYSRLLLSFDKDYNDVSEQLKNGSISIDFYRRYIVRMIFHKLWSFVCEEIRQQIKEINDSALLDEEISVSILYVIRKQDKSLVLDPAIGMDNLQLITLWRDKRSFDTRNNINKQSIIDVLPHHFARDIYEQIRTRNMNHRKEIYSHIVNAKENQKYDGWQIRTWQDHLNSVLAVPFFRGDDTEAMHGLILMDSNNNKENDVFSIPDHVPVAHAHASMLSYVMHKYGKLFLELYDTTV